jgi:hypothetical protein
LIKKEILDNQYEKIIESKERRRKQEFALLVQEKLR